MLVRSRRTSPQSQMMFSTLHEPWGTEGATLQQALLAVPGQIRRMGTGLVVLIADNDLDMRAYVRRCVAKHDMEIEEILEARDGQQALEVMSARRVDLLITDGAMPRLDGFALCTAVRRQLADHSTRVLLITGQFGPEDAKRRARAAGADGLLLKPFNALALCVKIDEVLRREDRRGPSSRSPVSVSESEERGEQTSAPTKEEE